MAGKEGSPKKDDGAGGSSQPAPVGGGSSPDSADDIENLGLENPDTMPHEVPRDASVVEQGKGSAPTGSDDMVKQVGQGSHGKGPKGKEVVSAGPGDVSAHGKGVDESDIEKMTGLIAGLPPVPPAQVPPPAPQAVDKEKGKRKKSGGSDGKGSSKRNKLPDPRTRKMWFASAEEGSEIKDVALQVNAGASAVLQGLHLQSPLAQAQARIPVPSAPGGPAPSRFQRGAQLCEECHRGPALTSLFAGHVCLCPPCHQVIQANPISTPCQVCYAQVIAQPPPQ